MSKMLALSSITLGCVTILTNTDTPVGQILSGRQIHLDIEFFLLRQHFVIGHIWICLKDIDFIPFSLNPIGSYSLVPSLQLLYGLRRGEGREPCVLWNTTQPSHTASWHNARLTRKPAAPMSASLAPGPPQESLVLDGRRTSLCAAPWVSQSRPAVTEPGRWDLRWGRTIIVFMSMALFLLQHIGWLSLIFLSPSSI